MALFYLFSTSGLLARSSYFIYSILKSNSPLDNIDLSINIVANCLMVSMMMSQMLNYILLFTRLQFYYIEKEDPDKASNFKPVIERREFIYKLLMSLFIFGLPITVCFQLFLLP